MHAQIVSAVYAAVLEEMATHYPSIVVAQENGPFDYSNPPPVYVLVEIKFYGGNQIGLAAAPRTRTSGFVYVTYHCREGEGTLAGLDVLDKIAARLAYSTLDRAQLQAATLADEAPPRGWHTDMIKVPFYADPA